MSIARLRAIQELKRNPEMLKLMADFKRCELTGMAVLINQLENEEEAALYFLNEEDKKLK